MKWSLLHIFLICICFQLSARPVKVACVGNSVTYGYLLEDREKTAYPVRLQKMLGSEYEVRNFGKSGTTLLNKGHRPYMQQQECKDAVAYAPDWVIIHLGLNDTDPRNWPNYRDDFTTDYLQLIDTFRMANPHCKIWICRMTPITHEHPRFKSGTRDWYSQIQASIEHVAEVAKVGLIDLQKDLYCRPDLLPDAVHPTAEGAEIIAGAVYAAVTGDYGGLQMEEVWGDNMVLQRERSVTIKGKANAGDKVTVRIDRQKKSTVTANDGLWTLQLEPLAAGGPYVLSVSASGRTLEFKNVLVGEVWLCSGQSNMAFMVKQAEGAKEALKVAENDKIRLFNMQPRVYTDAVSWDTTSLAALNRLDYFNPTRWQMAEEKSVADFSAIAYYFGKMLSDSLQVPVGLICNAVGGAPAESFIDRRTLEFDPYLMNILYNWTENDMIQDWARGRALLNIKNSVAKRQRHPYEPCYLYETAIRPLSGFPIKGIIWYQGESNAHNVELHEAIFPVLIDSWRKTWGENLPFYYVQLSGTDRPGWPRFRDSQRKMLDKIENCGMVVSSDWGNPADVHPVHKKEIGERMGVLALNKSYGHKNTVPSGPLFRSVKFWRGNAYITFDYGKDMRSADGQPLRTFEIAGEDWLFVPAKAEVKGNVIKISAPQVKTPKYVRYGWQPYTTANLINGAGLPASTFRSE